MNLKSFRFEPRRWSGGAALALAAALLASATETHTWTQGAYADFQKGVAKNLSLRSDGLLTLSPESHELLDSSQPYLWALARDSKGNLYAAGAGAKLYKIEAGAKGVSSKPKPVAEFDALEIHAIAVDSKDRVYAATSPDGKIYRLTGIAKPEVFYDPKAKYIWAMAFDRQGNLFVATGDHGEIHRVAPDGKGKVFFSTDATHVRSLTLDASDNLIVGTDPGGLVMRVSPAGEGFVLYQMPKPEVTAVAVAPDGSIYAAAAGARSLSAPAPIIQAVPQPTPAAAAATAAPGAAIPVPVRPAAPPPASLGAAGASGGSEVDRIAPDGNPAKEWSNAQDVVYSIAFDAQGHAVLGAGSHGNLYRVDSPTMFTSLLNMPVAQITALIAGPQGRLYAATGNVGKVYEIGPGLEHQGTIESDVFDSSLFTLWGRVSYEGRLNGGQIAVQTRSGNLDQPQKNWSPWSPQVTSAKGARVSSPASRFVQWKATLTADAGGRSPELESVDVAYLPKNIAPQIETIEITPVNYKFPAPTPPLVSLSGLSSTLTLQPLGRRASNGLSIDLSSATPTMLLAKGYIGARWLASDANGDTLVYKVEIKGERENEWKPLKDKVSEKYTSWDSTAFADGEYRVRVTASDSPGNPPSDALGASLVSDPFLIDNTPPAISGLTASRNGGKLVVRWHAADALSVLGDAEYSLDGGDWTLAAPVTKLSDSQDLDYEITLDAPAGEHTIAVRLDDDYANQATAKVVVNR